MRSVAYVAAAATVLAGCRLERVDPRQPEPELVPQFSGTNNLLQAVGVVDENVVWVSGHRATFLRTADGGRSWLLGAVPGPDTLQFRDVHGVNAAIAYLLAAGPADMSRIYKTTDGGVTWDLQWVNDEPDGFYDCFDFWTPTHGLAYGDAVGGELRVLETTDGETWTRVPADRLPAARGSEGGFAASGTCLVTAGDSVAWIATGAGDTARVLRTADRGRSWAAAELPVVSGTGSSGLTAIVPLTPTDLVAVGGDIGAPDARWDNVAVSPDGGVTWRVGGRSRFAGAAYGAAAVPGEPQTLVTVGPNGADYSLDGGANWVGLDTLNYWAVGFAPNGTGWAVGPEGRITRIRLYPEAQ